MSKAQPYDAGHVSLAFDDFECRGCGALPFEVCWCVARDDRDPTPAELEQSRSERLSAHERQALNVGEKP